MMLAIFSVVVDMVLGLLGTGLFYVIECAEGFLVPWHPSHRARHGNARGDQPVGLARS